MNKELMFSSKNQEWSTPKDLFKILDMEFNFQWDLAASSNNTKCKSYFSIEDGSALDIDWYEYFNECNINGYLWLNPPYGRSISEWVKKCYIESQKGVKIVALLPARTDTKWFHSYIYKKFDIRFLKGRIKFLLHNEEQDAAPFPSMIVIFDKQNDIK